MVPWRLLPVQIDPLTLIPIASAAKSAVSGIADAAAKPFTEFLDFLSAATQQAGAEQASTQQEEPAAAPAASGVESELHRSLLHEAFTGAVPSEEGASIELAEVREFARELQDAIEERIATLLEDAGIEVDAPVELAFADEDGELRVGSDTPQAVLTEAALSQDETLSGDLRHLSALVSLLQAADEHSEFADAYAADPYQAVEDYRGLLGDGSQTEIAFVGSELRFR